MEVLWLGSPGSRGRGSDVGSDRAVTMRRSGVRHGCESRFRGTETDSGQRRPRCFAVDRDWNITFFNREAERITGYGADEAVGRKCRDIFGAERCVKRCHLRQAMESGRSVLKARFEILNRNNRRIPVEITAAVLSDADGNVVGGVESILDLTARQALEKCVRQSYRFRHRRA